MMIHAGMDYGIGQNNTHLYYNITSVLYWAAHVIECATATMHGCNKQCIIAVACR